MKVKASKNLQIIREQKGLSRRELAVLCQISEKTIQRAENGENVQEEIIELIAKGLNVNKSILLIDGKYTEEQNKIIEAIDREIQALAGPGSGKTRIIVGRVMKHLKEGINPRNIVVFTFTEKAADELNHRIKSEIKKENITIPGISEMYVGTIHGFSLYILQEALNMYRDFEVLTPVRNRIFVDRYFNRIGVDKIIKLNTQDTMKIYWDTARFLDMVSILKENEADWSNVPLEIKEALDKYQAQLKEHRYFDFTSIMTELYDEIRTNSSLRKIIKENILYLIVDEYQDVNYLQEKLIKEIHDLGSNLFVVGDSDQNIYSWRGSDVENFLQFESRYPGARKFFLDKNFRSTQGIVDISNKIIRNNTKRDKNLIITTDNNTYATGDCTYKEFWDPEVEAEFIADRINELNDKVNVPFREMAVLVRTNKLSNAIIQEMNRRSIPYIVEGVNKLLETEEVKAAVKIFKYLINEADAMELEKSWTQVHQSLKSSKIKEGIKYLNGIGLDESKLYNSNLIQKVYWDFLSIIDIVEKEEDKNSQLERITYNLGKFSQVIHDYESINYETSPSKRFKYFCKFIQSGAEDYYPEGYLENPYIRIDGVRIMTIHQAKGLEFTAVFIPGLSTNLLPHQKIGGLKVWHFLPENSIKNSEKFTEKDIETERRLFYVAVTRSKKFLILTRSKYNRNTGECSEFLKEAKKSYYMVEYIEGNDIYDAMTSWIPVTESEGLLSLSYSTLSDFYECQFKFKLSHLYGFVQPIDEKINYGRSMHSIVSDINKLIAKGQKLSDINISDLIGKNFFLPYLTKGTRLYENLLKKCTNSTNEYYKGVIEDDMATIEFVEQKIEVPISESIIMKGRMDLVKKVDKKTNNLSVYIVDFKTESEAETGGYSKINGVIKRQLLIYSLGYEQLTGSKADFVQVHNLDDGNIDTQMVSASDLRRISEEIKEAASSIKNNCITKKCSNVKCNICYMKKLCLSKEEIKSYGIMSQNK